MEKLAENYEHTIQFFGFLASFFTLVTALFVYRKVGSNHIKTKQIDHVCGLIENLNQAKIELQFMYNSGQGSMSGSGYALFYNIFEIGNYNLLEDEKLNKVYEPKPVLFDKKSNQIIDIKKYIDHPLTPRKIANELVNFYNSRCRILSQDDFDQTIENFVFIKTGILDEHVSYKINNQEGEYAQGHAIVFISWENLKEHSKNLKKEISHWLVEQGIKENNMREDFKNPSQ